jgi:hypothetical protein
MILLKTKYSNINTESIVIVKKLMKEDKEELEKEC